MKKAIVKIIAEKFQKDISEIKYKLSQNRRKINRLSREQNELKGVQTGLYDILRQIKVVSKKPEEK